MGYIASSIWVLTAISQVLLKGMSQLTIRLSRSTYLFVKKEGIRVRKLLEYLEERYERKDAEEMGILVGHKPGRKAKTLPEPS